MEGENLVVEMDNTEPATSAATGVGKFAVMAGLAINLASAISPAASEEAQPELNATERFVMAWGDCIDE